MEFGVNTVTADDTSLDADQRTSGFLTKHRDCYGWYPFLRAHNNPPPPFHPNPVMIYIIRVLKTLKRKFLHVILEALENPLHIPQRKT